MNKFTANYHSWQRKPATRCKHKVTWCKQNKESKVDWNYGSAEV